MPAKTDPTKLEKAVTMYLQCANATTVEASTGVSRSVLYRALQARGIKPSDVVEKLGKPHQKSRLSFGEIRAVAEAYEAGEPASRIARRLGVCRATVVDAVCRSGVKVKPRGQTPLKVTPEMQAEIRRLWDEGHTQTYIAKAISINQTTISGWLRSGRIEVKRRNFRRSPLTYSTDGGRTRNQEGYVLIHKQIVDESLWSMAYSNGYIPEHRLVMSKVLGRPLLSHETVHHIDGNKTNNAPENLQLRHGKHGKGVKLICACCGSPDIIAEVLD